MSQPHVAFRIGQLSILVKSHILFHVPVHLSLNKNIISINYFFQKNRLEFEMFFTKEYTDSIVLSDIYNRPHQN